MSNNFSPELELSYQLTDSVSLYLNYSYFREPIEGSFFNGEPFQPETYQGLEVRVDTVLFSDKFSTSLYFFNESQNNITTLDPLFPDFDTQVNEQNSQSLGLELTSEIVPGWDVIIHYAYTKARIVEDDRLKVGNRIEDVAEHSGGFWTTYEIQTGALKGLGFGGGCWVVGTRPGDFENSFSLPSYLQTDAVVFYRSDDLKVAITIQNLFNEEVNTSDGIPLTIIGTVWTEF
ncbi:MAG: TonB-dependent receptor [Hydrococcus sp. RU_2_2]|nr:TonB-dependent receptor [Hydrococcus sp. RU_2_2]